MFEEKKEKKGEWGGEGGGGEDTQFNITCGVRKGRGEGGRRGSLGQSQQALVGSFYRY